MACTLEQAELIAGLKTGSANEFTIPIKSADGSAAGQLVPITYRLAGNADIVDALFRWRRARMAAFLSVFEATPEKTRRYLNDFSLPDPARILFLLSNGHGQFVGHIGLCNIAADGAEIDNVIRGEQTDVAGFMVLAHAALIHWAFSSLDLPAVYLNVLAHNTRAIRTYEKVGLVETRRTPLTREPTEDGYRLVNTAGVRVEAAGPVLVTMELRRQASKPTTHC